MKAGKVVCRFRANDGRRVILRTPRWEDLDDFLNLINSLADEGAQILHAKKVTREEEADWLSKTLASMEKGTEVGICAEVDGLVIGNSSLSRRTGNRSHTGDVGIIIKKGYRDIGIGTEMMKRLVEKGREMGLKVLTLGVFATNERARHVYEKMGFRGVGRIPKEFYRDGEYIDHIIMAIEL